VRERSVPHGPFRRSRERITGRWFAGRGIVTVVVRVTFGKDVYFRRVPRACQINGVDRFESTPLRARAA
jgi:hypothetical protein